MNANESIVYLPRLVFKSELAAYFGVSGRYLWRHVLTDDFFEDHGYEKRQFSYVKRFPPHITKLIYRHFEITDLNTSLADELNAPEDKENGHRAPTED
ncbi:MAG: hypothetical protein AAF597_11475 [Bacteroidota bacterium]